MDECDLGLDDCDDPRVADCINIPGSFSCTCKTGYTGNGRNGTCKGDQLIILKLSFQVVFPADIDECAIDTHSCNGNAVCTNTEGSFTCACYPGFTGDGYLCSE